MGKMSNAERQRKFRLNRDASHTKRQVYLTNCKEKYKKDKLCGKRKLLKDMTDRERRHARKQWRNEKKALRKRQEKAKEYQRTLITPPSSPEHLENQKGMSRQKQQARKQQNKERAKAYRDNKLKEIEIENLKRKLYSCRQRLNRLKEKSTDIDSPRTKTRRLLRNLSNLNGKRNVKRDLFNFQVLIRQLKLKYEKEQKRGKNERSQYFNSILKELSECPSYTTLKRKCQKIDYGSYNIIPHCVTMCSNSDLEADLNAVDYMPRDIQPQHELCPCIVHADGNCLPSCGSVLAFGESGHEEEIRVRIIAELVRNETKYLDNTYLSAGTENECKKSDLPKQYAQYSEEYIPGTKLSSKTIHSLYRKEVLSVIENNSFMGIWQLHALATVLNTPVYSVYPNLGNKNVRKDLNRLIFPLSGTSQNPVYIMWTSNREDMGQEHWIPNHFVPLLPVIFPEEDDSENMDFEPSHDNVESQNLPGDDLKNQQEQNSEDGVTVYVYKNKNGLYEISFEERENEMNEEQEKEISKDSEERVSTEQELVTTVRDTNEMNVEQEKELSKESEERISTEQKTVTTLRDTTEMSVEPEKDLSKESEERESTEQETVTTISDTNEISVEQEKELSKESKERESTEKETVTTRRDTNEMSVEQDKGLSKESEEGESTEQKTVTTISDTNAMRVEQEKKYSKESEERESTEKEIVTTTRDTNEMSVEPEKDLSKDSEKGESTEEETMTTTSDTNEMSVEQEKELSKESEVRESTEKEIVTTSRDTNEMSVEPEKDLSKDSEKGESTEPETMTTTSYTNEMSVEQEKELSKESEERESTVQETVTTMRDTTEIRVEQKKQLYKESEEGESVKAGSENKRSMENAHGINESQENKMSENAIDSDIYLKTTRVLNKVEKNELKQESETKQISIKMRMKRIKEVNERLNELLLTRESVFE